MKQFCNNWRTFKQLREILINIKTTSRCFFWCSFQEIERTFKQFEAICINLKQILIIQSNVAQCWKNLKELENNLKQLLELTPRNTTKLWKNSKQFSEPECQQILKQFYGTWSNPKKEFETTFKDFETLFNKLETLLQKFKQYLVNLRNFNEFESTFWKMKQLWKTRSNCERIWSNSRELRRISKKQIWKITIVCENRVLFKPC